MTGFIDFLSLMVKVADGVGIAPTQPGGSLGFRDRGIAALPTILQMDKSAQDCGPATLQN